MFKPGTVPDSFASLMIFGQRRLHAYHESDLRVVQQAGIGTEATGSGGEQRPSEKRIVYWKRSLAVEMLPLVIFLVCDYSAHC